MARGRPSRETIFGRFATALDELRGYGGLPRPGEAGPIWEDIWHLEPHNSTAIEGNTLVLREVEQLLDAGRAVGAKPLKDYLEVLGYGEAARWVYDQASGAGAYPSEELVTVTEVREVHRLALVGCGRSRRTRTRRREKLQAVSASMISVRSPSG